jgi:hypothetical protein
VAAAPLVEGDLMRLLKHIVPLPFVLAALPAQAELYITVVQGLGGESEYQEQFDEQRKVIVAAAKTLTGEERLAEFSGEAATREALLAHFTALNARMQDDDRAALYLIGHGSFDGFDYKFNLPGPDLTALDIKGVLEALPGKNHFVLNTSSTSGAMVEQITGVPAPRDASAAAAESAAPAESGDSNYLVIAATRNGNERNATHFGRYFAEALTSSEADINKNNAVSVQEAYDYAARHVDTFFTDAGRLATEHSQLRGNGAAQFSLSRLEDIEVPADADPLVTRLLEERQALDTQVEELQLRRNELGNAEYLRQLQLLILRTAELTERIEAAQGGSTGAAE